MIKIDQILEANNFKDYEEEPFKRIGNIADEINRDVVMINQGEWNTEKELEEVAQAREELPSLRKMYAGLRPISTILMYDPIIKEKYDEIQKVDTTSYYHGFEHIKNVYNTMKKFISLFNIDAKEADKLLTAVIFHDIGRGNVGKDHEKKSKDYFNEYIKMDLANEMFIYSNFNDYDLYDIKNAILLHEQKEDLDKLDNFQLLVNFADKLDVTKKRINLNNPLNPELPSYKYDLFREVYLDVNDVTPIIENGVLVLEFDGNENLTLDRLYSIPFMQVVDKLHKEFASRYNLEAQVRLSNTKTK